MTYFMAGGREEREHNGLICVEISNMFDHASRHIVFFGTGSFDRLSG